MKFAVNAKSKIPLHSLKYMLHQHMCGPRPGRGFKKIHASELTKPEGFCPRMVALYDLTGKKVKDEWLTTSQEMTFDIGRMVQDKLVMHFADMGKAVGDWKCLGCAKLHRFIKRPEKCVACGCKGFKPEEVRFKSALTHADCGVDMLLNIGQPKLIPVEIKTMGPEDFKSLIAPLSEHRLRTKLYLRIISECDTHEASMVDTSKARVFYVSKGGYGCADPTLSGWGLNEKFSPFKEFDISKDDGTETDEPSKRAKVVKDFRDGTVGVPCGLCPTALVKRALYCPMKGPCFSGDHPATYDWKNDALVGA